MKKLLLVTFYDENKNNLAYALYEDTDHFIAEHAQRRDMNYHSWSSIYLPEQVARQAYKAGMDIIEKGV